MLWIQWVTTQMPGGLFTYSFDQHLNTFRTHQLDSFLILQDYFHNLCSDCSAQTYQKTSWVGEKFRGKPNGKIKWFHQEKMLIVVPKPFPQGHFNTKQWIFMCYTGDFMSLPLRNNRRATQCSIWLWVTMWLSGQNKTRETWLLRLVLHHQL